MKKLAETTPDSCEVFESNLVDTYYPQRPAELEECCHMILKALQIQWD